MDEVRGNRDAGSDLDSLILVDAADRDRGFCIARSRC
jgi:hypothetical protein